MARADRRSAQRAKPAAVTRRSDVVIEDTMFFPRLRRHAKWMFLLLALAFALGFVGFGVGAGGVGVGDIFRGTGSGSGLPSVSEAQKRVSESPKDPQAFRDLANAQQAAGNTNGAIEALEGFVVLRPKNTDALRELAGLYLTKASSASERAQILQYRSQILAPGALTETLFQLGTVVPTPDPVTNAVTSFYETDISTAYGEAQDSAKRAVDAYKKIATALPKDPSVQLELAQAAQTTGDTQATIAAYEKFLRLAPDDPTAPEVKRQLKLLRASSGAGG
jgi:tetratricopeptide (TPR) repeat protein